MMTPAMHFQDANHWISRAPPLLHLRSFAQSSVVLQFPIDRTRTPNVARQTLPAGILSEQ